MFAVNDSLLTTQ